MSEHEQSQGSQGKECTMRPTSPEYECAGDYWILEEFMGMVSWQIF